MSWLNRINNIVLTITTGDGKVYTPLWKNAVKTINYNTEGFDFVGIEGTYVQREKKSGTQYPITLYFQGENCIDEANNFEISSRDSRAWIVKHPFYDEIRVQPLSLEFNNSQFNSVVITGTVWETLTDKFPESIVIPEKQIQNLKVSADSVVVDNYTVKPDSSLIQKATDSIESIEIRYNNLVANNEQASQLKQLVSSAGGAAISLVSAPLNFIREMQALINFPFLIVNDVKNKINELINAINDITDIFIKDDSDIIDLVTYDSLVSTSLSQISVVTTTPTEDDFKNRKDVVEIIDSIDAIYTLVLSTYDNKEYSQEPETALVIDNIINVTLVNLYEIAFNAKQERTIYLEKDDNIVNLSHRFIGPGDDNIEQFINENDIKLSEYLQLKKGRKIIWYV